MPTGILHTMAYLCTAAVVYGTVCPWIRSKAWWVRTMDFPRVQFCVVAAVALLILILADAPDQRWLHAGIGALLLVAMAIHVVRIYPFTRLSNVELPWAEGAGTPAWARVRVLVANLDYENEDRDRFLAAVRREDPDVVLAIETDGAWLRRLEVLEDTHPHGLREARPEGLGMALYSRLPLGDVRLHELVSAERPSIEARIELPGGTSIRFWGLHPVPPGLETSGGDRKSSKERDTELIRLARRLAEDEDVRSAIVAGDFNDAAWSPTTRLFKRVSGMRDPRVGRGLYNSYHARWWPLRYPIDHIFLGDSLRVVTLRRLEPIGSDHFPMLIEVALPTASPASTEDR